MNLEIFFIVIISLLGVQSSDADQVDPRWLKNEDFHKFHEQCNREYGVEGKDPQSIPKDVADGIKLCYSKKVGLVTKDNYINRDVIQEMKDVEKDNLELAENIDKCVTDEKLTNETITQKIKCLAEAYLTHGLAYKVTQILAIRLLPSTTE
ncbi:uncharacterized protein LOC114330100 isoform X2 [Diabrotica virgifera virgifera]|uniref:Uncharacterized protein n=2 Tax=Diabrotica virgifera virgifera TaxID=50390 RepID=A0ABM5IKY0_DIAVI|nr:uncharacterized protein LOC114330100 isoform X2 [Diabrotica virgifera virgifera]